jgi:hypothetical protein
MLLKHYEQLSFFFVGVERHRKSQWMGGGGVYNVGRYMAKYTKSGGIILVFISLCMQF